MSPVNVPAKYDVRSITRPWDNRGCLKIFGSPWIRPRSLFSKIFCSDGPYERTGQIWSPNLKSVALPVPGIIAIEVLGVANPQSSGKGGHRGSRMVPFKRALVSSYRTSIVTFPRSVHVSEILPLLCSNTPFFPTPPLVSRKSSPCSTESR